jgi:hypothetical protein
MRGESALSIQSLKWNASPATCTSPTMKPRAAYVPAGTGRPWLSKPSHAVDSPFKPIRNRLKVHSSAKTRTSRPLAS